MKFYKKNNQNDIGFGEKSYNKGSRLINKDGSFNVKIDGVPFFSISDMYHSLITIKWWQFSVVITTVFVIANIFFACIYVAFGVEQISSIKAGDSWSNFWDAFYFSSQTLTTVGFGYFAPVGNHAKIVASVEAFVGVLGFAVATGILYGRFSRPAARIRYSKNVIIAPYQDGAGVMFRMVNLRSNHLIELQVDLTFTWLDKEEGKRKYMALTLERNKINLMPLSWTVVHPIDEDSPFYGKTKSFLIESDAEILVLLKAFDESFSQIVYDKKSFRADEFVWGAKFVSIINDTGEGMLHLDIDKIDKYEEVSLNSPLVNI